MSTETTYRYRIMGRLLHGPEKFWGALSDGISEKDAHVVLAQARANAVEYGRWSDLRLERSAITSEWEPV